MERWKEHFEDLLNHTNTNRKTTEKTAKEEWKNKTEINEEINRDNRITLKEVQEAIKSVKNGKATGHDGITPEMIKRLGEIFRKAWAEGKIPQD
jgi:replicative superfamily II helicase